MPAADGTLTPEDVAEWLGAPVSPRIATATDAAIAYVHRLRSKTPADKVFLDPGTHYGGVLYAALLFQSRATPQGFAGYDEGAQSYAQSSEALWRARELIGKDPVI
jgi:hypothetical protein